MIKEILVCVAYTHLALTGVQMKPIPLNGEVIYATRRNSAVCELSAYKKAAPERDIAENALLPEIVTKPAVTVKVAKVAPKAVFNVSGSKNFKAYMDFRKITNTSSLQYQIQSESYTDRNGLRYVKTEDGKRYEVAVGTGYKVNVGDFVDVRLDDGAILHCVVADIKQDCDTDWSHKYAKDGSLLEFIVDATKLSDRARKLGDISAAGKKFDGSPVSLVTFNSNVIEE